jgi:hypothetical protein
MRFVRVFQVTMCASVVLMHIGFAQEHVRCQYVSPRPNSTLVSLETNVILRTAEAIDAGSLTASCINIEGSKSHVHTGRFILSDDERTMVFLPSDNFSAMESVTVSVGSGRNLGRTWSRSASVSPRHRWLNR